MLFNNNKPIAIIDSGIGGLCVLNKLQLIYPHENFIYFADDEYMPYGKKSKNVILDRISKIVNVLINKYDVKLVILACNTASVSVLEEIKHKYKINIIGLNPYARLEKIKNQNKCLIGTKLTGKLAKPNQKVISISNLAEKIEENIFDRKKLEKIIKNEIKKHNLMQYDDIVLACTHYEMIEDIFKNILPKTNFYAQSIQIINQLDKLSNILELNKYNQKGSTYFITSSGKKSYYDKLYFLNNKQYM